MSESNKNEEISADVSRRSFLERLAQGAAFAATGGIAAGVGSKLSAAATQGPPDATAAMNAGAFGMPLPMDAQATSLPAPVVNPNILMIMVDQLRLPQLWLGSGEQAALDAITPNIAYLRQNSVQFAEFYIAAQACSPSRATLLTGLYSQQTGFLATQAGLPGEKDLRSGFPTFGWALQDIAGYSANNVFWFGKWHVSNNGPDSMANHMNTVPLYGFNANTQLIPQWPSVYGSPNGSANQGNNGVVTPNTMAPHNLACDNAIASDFARVWATPPSSPWFAAVSFVNPHDIVWYPGFFPPNPVSLGEAANAADQGIATNPQNASDNSDFVPHYGSYGGGVVPSLPSGFNYETPAQLAAKNLDLQPWFQQEITDNTANGYTPVIVGGTPSTENQFVDYLNWYYYMVSLVDTPVGVVLKNALSGYSTTGSGNPTTNTAVIFLSDHGDYGGSHGLHAKTGAVYDEALRVPLYVMLPGQSQAAYRYQMCSMVDVFKLVVELGLGNASHNWTSDTVYKDQASRQSLFTFIYGGDGRETRTVNISGTSMAYIMSTTDELLPDKDVLHHPYNCGLHSHVICLRTKSIDNPLNPPSAYTGSKYSIYSKWIKGSGPIIDGATRTDGLAVQQIEFYDYVNLSNRNELGNNYSASPSTLQTAMAGALGNGPVQVSGSPVTPASGLVASELAAPLQGMKRDGSATLQSVTTSGFGDWNSYAVATLPNSCT